MIDENKFDIWVAKHKEIFQDTAQWVTLKILVEKTIRLINLVNISFYWAHRGSIETIFYINMPIKYLINMTN